MTAWHAYFEGGPAHGEFTAVRPHYGYEWPPDVIERLESKPVRYAIEDFDPTGKIDYIIHTYRLIYVNDALQTCTYRWEGSTG